jgi:hypothetical protein
MEHLPFPLLFEIFRFAPFAVVATTTTSQTLRSRLQTNSATDYLQTLVTELFPSKTVNLRTLNQAAIRFYLREVAERDFLLPNFSEG